MAFPAMGIEAVAKDIESFERGLNRMTNAIINVGKAADGDITYIGKFNAALGNIAVAGFTAAVGMAVTGVTALTGALVKSVDAASEAQQIWAQLESALLSAGTVDSLGQVWGMDMFKDLSMQFRDLAGGSDEMVASIIEMGIRMGTITADQMPKFIQTTLDLAAATGMDAVSAARLLAQAQDDPISALGRFNKLGIKVDKETEKRIKLLVAQGKVEEANALLMDRVGLAVQGRAVAMSETFAGRLSILKERIGDVFEAIGDKLLPILTPLIDKFMEFIDRVAPPLIDFFANKIVPAVKTLVDWLTTLLSLDASQLQNMLPEWVVTLWNDLNTAWDNIVKAWNENLQPALDGLGKWWSENSEDIISAASGIAGELGKIASQAITDGMNLLAEAIGKITSWLTDHKQDIKDGLGAIEKFVVDHGDQIKDFFKVVGAIVLTQLVLDLVGMGAALAIVAAPYIALGLVAAALATIYDVGEKAAKREMTDEDWEKLAPSEQAVASIKAAFDEIGKAISGTADEGTLGYDLNQTGLTWGDQIAKGIKEGILAPMRESTYGTAILNAFGEGIGALDSGLIIGAWTFWSSLALNMSIAMCDEFSKVDWWATFTNWNDIAVSFVTSLISAIATNIINSATTNADTIRASLIYLWDQLGNDLSWIAGPFIKIGEALVQGIIDGLNNKLTSLKNKVTEIINSIPDWVKDLLDIGSPSKVFEKIGENMMMGLEEGTGATGPTQGIKKNIGSVTMPPVINQSSVSRNQTSISEKNILQGASITNNTGFDLDAFSEAVRNA